MQHDSGELNFFWAQLLVAELVRLGVTTFIISPGSRSTPLTAGAALHPQARRIVHFDERGAGYCAVGYGRATGRPAALICTSGTAAANYLPAVVEAAQDRVPLLLLTADRPPELRDTQANQTIDQFGLFGRQVNWQVDLPCPTHDIAPEYLLTTVDEAVYRALRPPAGPVQVNCMFRQPLLPEQLPPQPAYAWPHPHEPYTRRAVPLLQPPPEVVNELQHDLEQTARGLLVVGALRHAAERQAVLALAQALHWPVCADIGSGLRLGVTERCFLQHHELLLQTRQFAALCQPETIVTIGGHFVSTRLPAFVAECPASRRWRVQRQPQRDNPDHLEGRVIEADLALLCEALARRLGRRPRPTWSAPLEALEEAARHAFPEENNEAAMVRQVTRLLPPDHGLFLAASLPVREANLCGDPRGHAVPIGTNRGASGIDGTLASAIGFAVGLGQPVTLIIGDLALLHDLNSLALLRQAAVPVVIVVLNNHGGAIFSLLPIARQEALFRPYFLTPHGYAFSGAAEMFGVPYYQASTPADFAEVYLQAAQQPAAALIEVQTAPGDYQATVQAWLQRLPAGA
jgi:2-succinyl-5-enolpyruvyl-6-hydroxy-3-cyclohexene-1-carboxylate synthase